MDDEKFAESITEKVTEAMTNSKKFFLCDRCQHKAVCKKIEEPETRCKDFIDGGSYKIYATIYDMFQPIFNWLSFHYPAGEVKFVVDRTSAKMYLEHGPFITSKDLTDFCICQGTPVPSKEATSVKEQKLE